MRKRGRAFWVKLVRECDEGASTSSVARRPGVSISTLRYWRWKLHREEPGVERRQKPAKRGKSATIRLLPVEVSPSAGMPASVGHRHGQGERTVEIGLPDGIVVRVHTGTAPTYVAELVASLTR